MGVKASGEVTVVTEDQQAHTTQITGINACVCIGITAAGAGITAPWRVLPEIAVIIKKLMDTGAEIGPITI